MDNRKIDALIAERVMGHLLAYTSSYDTYPSIVIDQATSWFNEIPQYSLNIAAAWLVVEKLRRDKYCCLEFKSDYAYTWTIWVAEVKSEKHEKKCLYDGEAEFSMAICLAALNAEGIEVPE